MYTKKVTMSRHPTIDVTTFINQQKLSGYQIHIVVLCFLIVAIDGFDTAAIGFIAPALRAEWQLSPAQLAPVFGAGLFGLMLGALLIGPFADRFGRKPVLLVSVFIFGLMCLLSAFAPDLQTLVILRFITGLGLGGAMPNAITLTSEYCPDRRRSVMVTTMFCGFTLGSALGGLASAALVEAYGWHSVLVVGGIMPLTLLPVLCWRLPESARFLVAQGRHLDKVRKILQHIAPTANLQNAEFAKAPASPKGLPVRQLFRPELVCGTLMIWGAFFMCLLVIYLLSSWLPTLLRSAGATITMAALITTCFQVGGTLGAITLGWLMDRFNPHYVLGITYLLAMFATASIGLLADNVWAVGAAVFLAGFGVSGGQVGANALSASFYPTDCRASGVSWANGIGRLGSVLGSMGGGALLAMGLSFSALFMIVGIPVLLAGLIMLALGMYRARHEPA